MDGLIKINKQRQFIKHLHMHCSFDRCWSVSMAETWITWHASKYEVLPFHLSLGLKFLEIRLVGWQDSCHINFVCHPSLTLSWLRNLYCFSNLFLKIVSETGQVQVQSQVLTVRALLHIRIIYAHEVRGGRKFIQDHAMTSRRRFMTWEQRMG